MYPHLRLHDSALEDEPQMPCDLTPQPASGAAVAPSGSPSPTPGASASTAAAAAVASGNSSNNSSSGAARLGLRSPKARTPAAPSPTASTSSTRRSLFSFPWTRSSVKRPTSVELQQSSASAIAAAHGATAVPSSPSHAAAGTAPATPSATAAAAAAPRRRWFRYPVRVPILSLLLVSLLARTSEGWTSIAGFLCGFLLFEGFSAPDTGQPNRIDAWVKRLIVSIQRWKRRRRHRSAVKRRAARLAAEAGGAGARTRRCSCFTTLMRTLRKPFAWCVRTCKRRRGHASHAHGADGATQAPLLRVDQDGGREAAGAPVEEDSDVLLDVALSVTEDLEAPPLSAAESSAATASASAAATAPSLALPGSAAGASAGAPSDAPVSTPLHALSELADSLSVSSLDASDLVADDHTTVVGGRAHFANVSVSLRFSFRSFNIHVHHWVYLLIVCGFLFLEQTLWSEHAASYPVYAFASAFCLGGSVQGLKYADWARVIWRRTQEARHERRQSVGGAGGGDGSAAAAAAAASATGANSTHRDGSSSHHSRHPSRAHNRASGSIDVHSPTESMERMESGESSALLGGGGGGGGAASQPQSHFDFPTDDCMPSPMPLARQPSQTHMQIAQLNLHA